MRGILCAALLSSVPQLGLSAPVWTLADLGRVDRGNHCLRAARLSFEQLLGEVRIGRIRTTNWVVYADAVNRHHDAIITCTFGDNRGTRATLVIHSNAEVIDAHLLKRRLRHLFTANARRIRKEWVESFD